MRRNLYAARWSVVLLVAAAAMVAVGCEAQAQKGLAKAELLVALPDYCNTPDGMSLQPDGSFILSMPNFNDEKSPPVMMRVTADNKAEKWYDLPDCPGAPDNLKRIRPMGVSRAPDGNLYLADMQYMIDKNGKSRMWKIVVKDGKPEKMVLVAQGFNVANGTAVRDGYVYITESVLDVGSDPLTSGVLRFKLDEENVTLKAPLATDPHVIATFKATLPNAKKWAFGADGLTFDSKGNLFIGQFGEGIIYKLTFDKTGKVVSNKVFAKGSGMINCDGMTCDPRTDNIYVPDSANNAIQVVSPDGKIQPLAINGPVTDKKSGLLCQPCEALLRGNTIIASNMDWPFPGFKNEKIGHKQPATLSVIKLP